MWHSAEQFDLHGTVSRNNIWELSMSNSELEFNLALAPDEVSIKAAVLLSKFKISFRVFDGSEGVELTRGRCKAPILTVVQKLKSRGYDRINRVGLTEIQNFLREYVLRKPDTQLVGIADDSLYTSHVSSIHFPYRQDGKSVICFNEENKEVYSGPIEKCPFPLLPVFAKGRQKGPGSMWEIAAWKICHLDREDFSEARAIGKPFINHSPAAVLMPEEVQALGQWTQKGWKDACVVTEDSGYMAQYWFEAYFSHQNELYRLRGHDPD